MTKTVITLPENPIAGKPSKITIQARGKVTYRDFLVTWRDLPVALPRVPR